MINKEWTNWNGRIAYPCREKDGDENLLPLANRETAQRQRGLYPQSQARKGRPVRPFFYLPISHLWMQGVVSAEAFVSDKSFRSKLKSCVKIKSNGRGFEHLLPSGREKVNRDEFKVVYGIMRDAYANGTMDIPFFSKVSFQSAVDKLNKLNISIAIELIEKIKITQRCDND